MVLAADFKTAAAAKKKPGIKRHGRDRPQANYLIVHAQDEKKKIGC